MSSGAARMLEIMFQVPRGLWKEFLIHGKGSSIMSRGEKAFTCSYVVLWPSRVLITTIYERLTTRR